METARDQTTIALSRKNHRALSRLGTKGQSFDEVVSEILRKLTDSRQEKPNVQQPKFRVDPSLTLAAELPSAQTALESDSGHE